MGGEVGASQYALYLNLKGIPWALPGSVVLGSSLHPQETSSHVIAPVELKLVWEVLQEKEDHLMRVLSYLAHVVVWEASSLYLDLIQILVPHPLP